MRGKFHIPVAYPAAKEPALNTLANSFNRVSNNPLGVRGSSKEFWRVHIVWSKLVGSSNKRGYEKAQGSVILAGHERSFHPSATLSLHNNDKN